MGTGGGYIKWIQEVDVTSGYSEVNTGSGYMKWIQEVDRGRR